MEAPCLLGNKSTAQKKKKKINAQKRTINLKKFAPKEKEKIEARPSAVSAEKNVPASPPKYLCLRIQAAGQVTDVANY